MMAPIVVKGSTARRVYFPAGQWQHLFTGEVVTTRGFWKEVKCRLGTPAAFKRIGGENDLKVDFRIITKK